MHFFRQLLCAGPLAMVAALALAACSDGAPAPTPTPTAVPASPPASPPVGPVAPASPAASGPAPAACPVADAAACVLAGEIQRALQVGDADRLVSAFKGFDLQCSPPPGGGALQPAALCAGRTAGDRVVGYNAGERNGRIDTVSRAALVQLLSKFARGASVSARDDYGDGLPRLFTVAQPAREGCTVPCALLVYSYAERLQANAERYTRRVMAFDVDRLGDRWTVNSVADGGIFPTELPAILAGGQLEARTYAAWSPGGGAAPAATPPGPFAFGQTLRVAGGGAAGCAERRTGPAPAAPVADCLRDGTPVQADLAADVQGQRWWNVRPIGPGTAGGWLPAAQLRP